MNENHDKRGCSAWTLFLGIVLVHKWLGGNIPIDLMSTTLMMQACENGLGLVAAFCLAISLGMIRNGLLLFYCNEHT